MFLKLVLLFTVVPVLELYLLIRVGSVIGAFDTILIIFLTGVVGAWLARMQGIQIMMQIQQKMRSGQMPHDEMIQGVIAFIGGITLLTPGFLTDIIGLSLIFPLTRKLYSKYLQNYFQQAVQSGQWVVHTQSPPRDIDITDL